MRIFRKRLILTEETCTSNYDQVIDQVIGSFENLLVRIYSKIRFRIIPLRFLQEISQYMPKSGYILDLGCGFGLFTLYYAAQNPNVRVIGIDISSTRIEMAKKSAQKLGIRNVEFLCLNATKLSDLSLKFDIVVALDVLHHLPVQDGNKIIEIIYQTKLSNGGSFILKDITTHPRYMLYFTFILDLLMNPKDSFYYRSTDAWITCFKNVGFCQVEKHYLWDILPYPHILLLARKPDS